MSMTDSMDENLAKSLSACDKAKDSDLIFFPEIQLSPFFPQYEKRDASKYLVTMDSPYVKAFINKAKEINSCIVPNMYMEIGDKCYDCCVVTTGTDMVQEVAKMLSHSRFLRLCEILFIYRIFSLRRFTFLHFCGAWVYRQSEPSFLRKTAFSTG